ncbi:MAG: phage portal protein [Pedobacter sp.]|nr:MAG: phage portal protein [Pedobacter sp.]
MSNSNKVQVLKFEASTIPQPNQLVQKDLNKYQPWGNDNLYPHFLLKLYANCSAHQAIVNGKTDYILGDGLKYKDGKGLDFKANASDHVKELVMKCVKDYVLFGLFAVEVEFNVFGEAVGFHHIPGHKVRMNSTKSRFWTNRNWALSREYIVQDRWKAKPDDGMTKVFLFDNYTPSLDEVYPMPEYHAAIKSMVIDMSIKDFNENNINNHFSVSNLITFFQGSNIPEEMRQQILDDLKASYRGANGSKFIVDFQDTDGKSAEVKNLSVGDWHNAYLEIAKNTKDDIIQGHQIPSGLLFGVKEGGQLGGSTELEAAYQLFKNTYVMKTRGSLESAFNLLFSNCPEVKGEVAFTDRELFKPVMADALKQQIMTINEIRAEHGLPAIAGGDRFIGQPAPETQPAEPAVVEQAEDPLKKKTSRKLSEEEYDLVKDFGVHQDEFEVIGKHQDFMKFGKEEDVAKYIVDNDIKDLTVDQLKGLLNNDTGHSLASGELKDILTRLNESGTVKVSYGPTGKVSVMPNKVADVPDSDSVLVMYMYELRPEVDGPDLLPTSRSFCKKMIQNNRLYSRAEIQQMSGIFQYDIMAYAGGFKYDPVADVTTPYCRHQWTAYKVKRKNK